MKRFLAVALLCIAPSLFAQSQYAQIVGTNVADAAGNKLLSGTISFTPVTQSGAAIAPNIVSGGRVIPLPVTFKVINGVITPSFGTAQLVDVTQANPSNFCYKSTIHDNLSGQTWTPDSCLQPASTASWCTVTGGVTTCDYNKYVPVGTPGALEVAGPVGPPGPNCATTSPAGTCDMQGTDFTNVNALGAPTFAAALSGLKAVPITSLGSGTPALLYGEAAQGDVQTKAYLFNPGSAAAPDDDTVISPASGSGQWLSYPSFAGGYGLSRHMPNARYVMCGIDSLSAGAGAPTDSGCKHLYRIMRAQIGDGGPRFVEFDDLTSAFYGDSLNKTGSALYNVSTQQPAAYPAAVNSNNPWIYSLSGYGFYSPAVIGTATGGGGTTEPQITGFTSGGALTFAYISNAPSCDFNSAPTITLYASDGIGSGATGHFVLAAGCPTRFVIDAGGSGYHSSGTTTGAIAGATLAGGSGYSSPSISFSGCTSAPTANIGQSGGVVWLTFTSLGSGCTSPTATISDTGSGSGASVTLATGTTSSFTWGTHSNWTTAQCYYLQQPGGGSFSIGHAAEGGSDPNAVTQSTNGALSLQSVSIDADSTTSDLSFALHGAAVVYGCDYQLAGATGASFTLIGRGGQLAGQVYQFSTSFQQQWFSALKPDVVFYEGGMNDRTTVSAATLQTYAQQFITNVRAGNPASDVVLVRSNDSSDALTTNLASYGPMLQALAAADGVGFVSVRDAFGTFKRAAALGLMNASTNGSGAAVSCNYSSAAHTCTSYTISAGGTGYTTPPGIQFWSTYNTAKCPISPLVNVVVSGGAVTSVTNASPGYCVSAPGLTVSGGGACTLSSGGVATNCDGIHPSSGVNTYTAGGDTVKGCLFARYLGYSCNGHDGGWTPLPGGGSSANYGVQGALNPFYVSNAPVGTPVEVYNLGMIGGYPDAQVILDVWSNRYGTSGATHRQITIPLSNNTTNNQTRDCTGDTIQSRLLWPLASSDAMSQDFSVQVSYVGNQCQIWLLPSGYPQNLNVQATYVVNYAPMYPLTSVPIFQNSLVAGTPITPTTTQVVGGTQTVSSLPSTLPTMSAGTVIVNDTPGSEAIGVVNSSGGVVSIGSGTAPLSVLSQACGVASTVGGGRCGAAYTPPTGQHVVRFQMYFQTAPLGCTTYPIYGITDGTNTVTSLTATSGQAEYDSGALTGKTLTAATKYWLAVLVAGSGCSPAAASMTMNATLTTP